MNFCRQKRRIIFKQGNYIKIICIFSFTPVVCEQPRQMRAKKIGCPGWMSGVLVVYLTGSLLFSGHFHN
jgi:hypothetical protein